MALVKEQAVKLINELPSEATWDDIMYELYVKKKLAVALKATEEGKVITHDEVKQRCPHSPSFRAISASRSFR